jgi:hypothetical protein
MAKREDDKVRSAEVHRPTDSGVDLPAGKKADELEPSDYRAVEMDGDTGGTPASIGHGSGTADQRVRAGGNGGGKRTGGKRGGR